MNLRHAVWALVLAPVVAFADGVTTPVAASDSPVDPKVEQQTQPSDAPTADAKDEKKPEAEAKKKTDATQEKRADTKLANAVQARTPEEQARQSGFIIGVSLGHELGMGTFVDVRSYAYLGASLSIAPRYQFSAFGKRLAAFGSLGLSWEYTMPDTETGRGWGPSDLRLGVSAPVLFRDKTTGINVTPSVSMSLPVRPESWNAGLITSISAGAMASRSIGNFDIMLQASASRGLFTQASNNWRPSNRDQRDSQGNLIWLCRPDDVACASSGNNTAWTAGFNLMLNWRATGDFIVTASYGLSKSWRYSVTDEVDEYTSKAIEANGNPAARVGMGQMDMMSTNINLSYQLNSHYSINGGLSTSMPPLTATGQVRFPFFSIGNTADNASTVYFSISAFY